MGKDKWMQQLLEKNQIETILKTNEFTMQFGVCMSEEDAKLLARERFDSLKEQQRIEFHGGILQKLIFAFCDSTYIYQENYMDTIGRLQEIFYQYKNEALDELTDDELIMYMKDAFEGICQGSLDYLEDTYLEKIARSIRSNTKSFMERDEEANEFL